MKSKYLIINLLFLAVISCSDVLDVAPDGRLTKEEIFSDNEKIGAYLNTLYKHVPAKGAGYFFTSRGPVVWSDEAWDTDAEVENLMSKKLYNGDASAFYHPILDISDAAGNGDYWNRYWESIRSCNEFIISIKETTANDKSQHNRWLAEAHTLRAFYYSELLKWFGANLPIQEVPLDINNTDYSTLKKESYYDIVKFIIADCQTALSIADLPWRITIESERGRVTKAMAEAIKSQMILYAASPLNNDGENRWEEAYTICKQSLKNLKGNGYSLYKQLNRAWIYLTEDAYFGPDNNYNAAIYNEYFTNDPDFSSNPTDKETIYASIFEQFNIPTHYMDGIGCQDGIKTGSCPSQELVDSYETIDGKPILNLANPYSDEKHLIPNYNPDNTLYNPQNPYVNRDPRFYASIYYNGSKRKCFWGFSEVPESPENYPGAGGNRTRIIATYVGEPQTGIDRYARKATRTGYFNRKFLQPFSGSDYWWWSRYPKLYRLGEVILNFAEAAAESGHLEEAINAVNEIRGRAGMPDLPPLGQEELILRIRNERKIELALEGHRYFDVRRWCRADGNLEKTDKWITAAEIFRKDDGTYTYGRRTVQDNERRCYTNKFLWVPIPLNEVNRLRFLTGEDWQRPGW